MTFLKNVHPLIVQINEKLMEMARGDFNTFIPKSSEQGEIESIAMSVNMLSETLAHRIRQTAYSTKTNADHYFQVFHLQLDEDLIIRDFSTLSCSLLNVPANQLANASIASFLSERSYNNLCTVVKQLHSLSKETVTVSLEFQHHSVPFFYETQVQYSSYTQMFTLHLTAIRFKKFTPETDTPSKSRAEQRDYVERQIQKIHTYLCRPENSQRATLDFLSRKFFINKEILKTKFKEMYRDTVCNFHLRMRIEQSRLLVTSTKKPLKEIAATTGFNCYASFHRTFVKHHHVSPKILRKRMQKRE